MCTFVTITEQRPSVLFPVRLIMVTFRLMKGFLTDAVAVASSFVY